MAILDSLIFDNARQSIGRITIQKWRDKTVARKKPTQVSNPKTVAQEFQRERIRKYNILYKVTPFELKAGFKEVSKSITEWNSFVRENTKSKFLNENNEYQASNFITAKGSLSPTPILNASLTGNDVTLTWSTTKVENQSDSDYTIVIIKEINGGGTTFINLANDLKGAVRTNGTITVTCSRTPTSGDRLCCYIAFSSADNRKQSNTVSSIFPIP